MANRTQVVLVDETGRSVEPSDKHAAHEAPGQLHRAFSVFLFRHDDTMLVQQRAQSKYHFGGIWANACCSHPEPGEDLVTSAQRRVREELGIECELTEVGSFTYRAVDPVSGLVEHEFDHVLVGQTTARELAPDPDEVQDWRFVEVSSVTGAGEESGYAPWFSEALAMAVSGYEDGRLIRH